MNDTIRAALVTVIKSKRQKMSRAERQKGVRPQRWLYPYATESRYAATIRAWLRPIKNYVHTYLKENQDVILRGDSTDDNIPALRLDAVPGKSFKVMVNSLNGWLAQYVPTDDESKSGSPIYMGLGEIADTVFDFNDGQFEKGAKTVLGVEFPVGEDWWPDARDTWANKNYELIQSDMKKYIGQINELTEKAVTSGLSVKSLTKQILALDDKISKSRANFIARDQIGKLNGQITQMRMEAVGLEMYIWETSGDERVRESHELIDGALCRWDDSTVFSQDGGKTWIDRPSGAVTLHPGMDYQCRCTAVAYWQELVGEADAMIAEYEELDALSAQNIAAMPQTPPPTPEPGPKKFVTQKMLQAEASDIGKQMKELEKKYGGDIAGKGTAADKQLYSDLQKKKEGIQSEIENRKIRAEKKRLTKELKAFEKELKDFEIKTYSGIWKDDVTVADYEAKVESIPQKRAFYEMKLKSGDLSSLDRAKYRQFLQDLKDFEVEAKRYADIKASISGTKNRLTSLRKGAILDDSNPFSQARKDAALWAKGPKVADDMLRGVCGEVWQKATKAEREAIYAYTTGPGGFNRPLRGIDQNKNFKGVGKVPLNNEGRGTAIANMTKLINRSKYDFDMWLQRGISSSEGAASFLGTSESNLRYWSQAQLQSLVGKEVSDQGFVSCGSSKGYGFNTSYTFNIYCPRGTKMMYAEPFSDYGAGARSSTWDGKSGQKSFGSEDETIIQRGSIFRITKVEKKGGSVFFDVEVTRQI